MSELAFFDKFKAELEFNDNLRHRINNLREFETKFDSLQAEKNACVKDIVEFIQAEFKEGDTLELEYLFESLPDGVISPRVLNCKFVKIYCWGYRNTEGTLSVSFEEKKPTREYYQNVNVQDIKKIRKIND